MHRIFLRAKILPPCLLFGKNGRTGCLTFLFFHSYFLPAQIAVELEKVNVLVTAFENPITVAVSDLPDSCLLLESSAGKVRKDEPGRYTWWGATDSATLTLTLVDTCRRELVARRTYRVKEIPVEPLLGARYRSRAMPVGEFRAQAGIAAVVTGYDIDAKCDMAGFTAHFFSKKTGEVRSYYNTGARFQGEVSKRVDQVQSGDWVRFSHISYRCPGMKRPRFSDDDLYFRIK